MTKLPPSIRSRVVLLRSRFATTCMVLLVVAVLGTACKGRRFGLCSRGDISRISLQDLPKSPLEAATAVGRATVEEKDPAKLAGMLASLLRRANVPIANAKGDGLVYGTGPIDPSRQLILFEPLVLTSARATTQGDLRPMSTVLRGLVPSLDPKALGQVDLGAVFLDAAREAASEKAATVDAMLVTAIAASLEARKDESVDPSIDPTTSTLLGVWLTTGLAGAAPSGAATGRPALGHALDSPFLHGMGAAVSAACKFMSNAGKASDEALGWFGDALNVGKYASSRLKGLSKLLSGPMAPLKLVQTIMEGLAGMGIAAVVEVDGDVKPTKVKYGDGPARYEVRVESKNPFNKKQMDAVIDCLSAMNPGGESAFKALRDIPGAGPMEGVPVLWTGTEQYDPEHGTFTADNASVPSGLKAQLVKLGAQVTGNSVTDASGRATAKFQVKSKGKGEQHGYSKWQSFTISAIVIPFPISTSYVYGPSNLLWNRAVPIRLEINVPLPRNWVMHYRESDTVTGAEISGGWSIKMEADVPFRLGANLDFDGTGAGTWQFGFSGTMAGVVHCTAPVQGFPLEVRTWGKVLNPDTMDTDFRLSGHSGTAVNSSIKCKGPGGIAVNAPLKGPASRGSAMAGSPMEHFQMPLQRGATKRFNYSKPSGGGIAKVRATITLEPVSE